MTRKEHIIYLLAQHKARSPFDFFGTMATIVNVESFRNPDESVRYTFWLSDGEAFRLNLNEDEAKAL